MDTVECPYCEGDVEICHDDGAYYNDGESNPIECEHCEKKFMVNQEISWIFTGEKAECLNTGEHDWKKRYSEKYYPNLARYEECRDCNEQRTLPANERK